MVKMRWMMLGMIALGSCTSASAVAPLATVRFVIVAPLCSSIIPVQLSIDHQPVATDTFRVAINPVHTTSRDFSVSAGPHTLGARVISALGSGYVWPDTTVTLAAGAVAADSLPFYCS
jgi:hypothetical protein